VLGRALGLLEDVWLCITVLKQFSIFYDVGAV